MHRLGLIFLKYFEVLKISLKSKMLYFSDQLFSTVFLVTIMFVFIQLWETTYSTVGTATLSGYTFSEMIWYLVATEGIILSLPRVHLTIEQEVKSGDLAIRLNQPYHYLLFHYSSYLGEGLSRLITTFGVGGVTTYLLIGGIPFQWEKLPILLFIYTTTQALHFCYGASIGLSAFWTEDVSGLYFVFDRMKWILGGFLLPLEVFPDTLRPIVQMLPFQYMIYGPAKLFIHFNWESAYTLLCHQMIWLLVLGLFCSGIYSLGVRRVDINGG